PQPCSCVAYALDSRTSDRIASVGGGDQAVARGPCAPTLGPPPRRIAYARSLIHERDRCSGRSPARSTERAKWPTTRSRGRAERTGDIRAAAHRQLEALRRLAGGAEPMRNRLFVGSVGA